MWQKNHLCDVVVELPQLYEMYCSSENSEYKKMKYFLQENFRESICFTRECWIQWIPPNCSSCTLNESFRIHDIASIIRAGLRDKKIVIYSPKMIHWRIKARETEHLSHGCYLHYWRVARQVQTNERRMHTSEDEWETSADE